jgi:hypothetical protein
MDLSAARFAARGFAAAPADRQHHLEAIGETFIEAFNVGLTSDAPLDVRRWIDGVDADRRGFAAEGATMGVAVADAVGFRSPRLATWLSLAEADFTYLAHVGVGWALARLPWCRRTLTASLDPMLRWLAYDGLGFHDAYFKPRRALSGWRRERLGYAARAYDQGLGRALWFICGAEPREIARAIGGLSRDRHGDLWSGVGLAMAYAGGGDANIAAEARTAAGPAAPMLAQGAAFAAEAHARAGQVPIHTAEIVLTVTGLPIEHAVSLVRATRRKAELGLADGIPQYERWRVLVQQALGEGP